MNKKCLLIGLLFCAAICQAQKLTIAEYAAMKAGKISQKSPFEKIIERELPATIVL